MSYAPIVTIIISHVYVYTPGARAPIVLRAAQLRVVVYNDVSDWRFVHSESRDAR